jgi:hypothetical protein
MNWQKTNNLDVVEVAKAKINQDKMKKLVFDLPLDLQKRFKIWTINNDTTMANVLNKLLNDFMADK